MRRLERDEKHKLHARLTPKPSVWRGTSDPREARFRNGSRVDERREAVRRAIPILSLVFSFGVVGVLAFVLSLPAEGLHHLLGGFLKVFSFFFLFLFLGYALAATPGIVAFLLHLAAGRRGLVEEISALERRLFPEDADLDAGD
jgi:hypothetical protein